jgi:hypothetical protein
MFFLDMVLAVCACHFTYGSAVKKGLLLSRFRESETKESALNKGKQTTKCQHGKRLLAVAG